MKTIPKVLITALVVVGIITCCFIVSDISVRVESNVTVEVLKGEDE